MVGFCVPFQVLHRIYTFLFFFCFLGVGVLYRERAVSIPPENCALKSFTQIHLRDTSYAFRGPSYAFMGNQKNENLFNIQFLYLEAFPHMHLWGTEKVSMYQEPPQQYNGHLTAFYHEIFWARTPPEPVFAFGSQFFIQYTFYCIVL